MLPERPLLLSLTVRALTVLVVPPKVIFSVEGGELLSWLDLPGGTKTDHLACEGDKFTVGLTVVVDEGDGANDNQDSF